MHTNQNPSNDAVGFGLFLKRTKHPDYFHGSLVRTYSAVISVWSFGELSKAEVCNDKRSPLEKDCCLSDSYLSDIFCDIVPMQENFLFDNLTKLTKWRFTTVGSPFSSDDFDGFSGCMDFELFRSSFEKQLSRSSEREDETECLLKNDIFPALERICLKTREILLETVLNGKHFEKPTMAIVKDLSGVFADGFAENREYRIVEFYERIGRKYLKLTDGCGHSVVLNAARVEFA